MLLALIAVLAVSFAPSGDANEQPDLEDMAAMSAPAPVESADAPVETTAPESTATVAAVTGPVPAPNEPKPEPEATLPEKMDHLPDSTSQVIVITGKKIGSNSGTLAVYNRDDGRWTEVMSTEANFGKNGLVDGKKRRSGNLQTPTGIWEIGSFVFGLHDEAPSGTQMKYRPINENSWWSAERNSTYNTWVTSKSHVNGEHLIDADPQYEYAFDTGYNAPPNKVVLGRGTAIFIHCFEPPGNRLGKYTHGCIAIHRKKMVDLFGILDPERNPICAIGTLKKDSSTSIWAY